MHHTICSGMRKHAVAGARTLTTSGGADMPRRLLKLDELVFSMSISDTECWVEFSLTSLYPILFNLLPKVSENNASQGNALLQPVSKCPPASHADLESVQICSQMCVHYPIVRQRASACIISWNWAHIFEFVVTRFAAQVLGLSAYTRVRYDIIMIMIFAGGWRPWAVLLIDRHRHRSRSGGWDRWKL